MADLDVAQLKAELVESGFRAQRFSLLVNKVRRLLWPLIRPYHFFVVDALGERLARQSDEINRLSDNLQRLVASQSVLRTDVAAAVNRYLSIEAEWDRRFAESGNWLTEFGPRNRLFLCVFDYGLVILKMGDYISDVVATEGKWDAHIVDLIKEVASSRQGTAIDVGAHIGLISIVMGRFFPQVVSFEPNGFNYALLVANITLNGLSHVRCFNQALYSRDASLSLGADDQQEIPLSLDPTGKFDGMAASNLGAYNFTERGSGKFATKAVTLDSLAMDDVAFIKIDVQGADGEVILGAADTIRRCRPIIVFEWETLLVRQFSVTLDCVRSFFSDIGYTIEVLKVHNEKQTDYVAHPTISPLSTGN